MIKNTLKAVSLSVLLAACSGSGVSPSMKSLSSAWPLNLSGTEIIGGIEAVDTDEFSKTLVGLIDQEVGALCTASIMSNELIVTAAHCVTGENDQGVVTNTPPENLVVVFGLNLFEEDKIQARKVVAVTVHSSWAEHSYDDFNTGDIAIVRFAGGLPAGYKPAQFLTKREALTAGMPLRLAGYGISDGRAKNGEGLLRYVDNVPLKNPDFSETEILLDQTSGRGACHGDSGGPAYVTVDGNVLVTGVTSRGHEDPLDLCNGGAAYTSIPAYTDWIVDSANQLQDATSPAFSL